MNTTPLEITALIFPGFELLDLFGPLELFGILKDEVSISLVAEKAEAVASYQGPRAVADLSFADVRRTDVLLVPGGMGTRREVNNAALVDWLRAVAGESRFVASVCTGAALLARAGILDGKRATSNKRAFDWVKSQGAKVQWVNRARWVEEGNIFTSSGISAGMDMALGLIERLFDRETSLRVASQAEYLWNDDSANDPFAV